MRRGLLCGKHMLRLQIICYYLRVPVLVRSLNSGYNTTQDNHTDPQKKTAGKLCRVPNSGSREQCLLNCRPVYLLKQCSYAEVQERR